MRVINKFSKANWKSYSEEIIAINSISLVEDHLEAYEAFENSIYTSSSKPVPTT